MQARLAAGEGCRICGNTGYVGRIAIFEVMPITEPIKILMLERGTDTKVREQARKEGMIAMKQDGLIKVLKGQTTLEEVIRVTKE
jgi:type II secretory ATPase GspE/PulE/Tfp pilus assembly ATPase PilB-like protein